MQYIIDWLNNNNGSIMVIITSVYVIATICVCAFNGMSAKATQKQVIESKRQFDETNRLQVMPFFEMNIIENDVQFNSDISCLFVMFSEESENNDKSCSLVSLKNLGSGIAHNIRITITTRYKKNDGYPANNLVFPPNAEKQTYVCFSIKKLDQEIGRKEDILVNICYEDILGNKYKQESEFIFLEMQGYTHLLPYVKTSSPKLVQESERNTND